MQKVVLALTMIALLSTLNLANSQYQVPRADAVPLTYHIRIDGVPGETISTDRTDWIDIDSFNFGMTAPSANSGSAAKAQFGEISFTKPFGKSSPLMIDAAKGRYFPKAQLFVVGAEKDIVKWTFSDVLIRSYEVVGEPDSLKEKMSISFTKIEVEYVSGGAKVKFGWDIKANKKI
jgi:type VI secretion system secreted protein Hcp